MKDLAIRALLIPAALFLAAGAHSAELVDVGGPASLERPGRRPIGSIILMPGGDGYLGIAGDGSIGRLQGNQLIRTRGQYVRAGFAVLSLDASADPAQAVRLMRSVASPVVVVATSRGVSRAPRALAGQPDGLVLTSGMLDAFMASVGSPGALPRTLVVHHRRDGCAVTPPSAVERFAAWAGGRVSIVWLDGGTDAGDPCQAAGHHGFAGLDGSVVSIVTRFARR
jgi:hypothetical protein